MSRVACIDIGTVTARLAVADVEGGRVARMAKHSEIVNLGEGVDATRRLSQEAMERTFACVRGYVDAAREAGCQAACCTLTSAARDAQNSWELGAALDSIGLDPLIIPGQVEGALTFLGVAQDFPGEPLLVADSGGGSTELALGRLGADGVLDLRRVRSVDVGCRRVTEKFLSASAVPSADDLRRAHEFVAGQLAGPVAECVPAAGTAAPDAPATDAEPDATAVSDAGTDTAAAHDATAGAAPEPLVPARLVVVGGTATSVVAIEKRLEPYDPSQVHLARVGAAQLDGVERLLASMPVERRAQLPGLQAKRAPVMLGGAVVVGELLRQTGFDELVVSESDLLFGLALAADAAVSGRPGPVPWTPSMRPLR